MLKVQFTPAEGSTLGVIELMADIDRTWDDYDPWESCMAWLFALAETTYVTFGEILPEFIPAITLNAVDDLEERYETDALLYMINTDALTLADIRETYTYLMEIRADFIQRGIDH